MKKLFTFLFAFLCTTLAFGGTGTKADPYTVAEAIAKNNDGSTAFVKGFIVGTVNIEFTTVTSNSEVEWSAPFTRNSAVVIADSKDTRDISQCVFVQLPTGAIRDEINLMANPGNIGKWLNVQGTLKVYFGQIGLKDPTDYEFEGATVSGKVLFEESFATSIGNFTAEDKLGEQNWYWRNNPNSPTSPGYMYMSGNKKINEVETPFENEDLLISPAIDLTGAKAGTYITFKQALNFADATSMRANQTLWVTDGTNEEQITIVNYPAGTSWSFVDAGQMAVPEAFLKAGVKIIFKYKSVTPGPKGAWGAWEVNDVKIVDPSAVGVNSVKESIAVQIYPNPATSKLNVNVGDISASVAIFDITGKMVNSFENVSGNLEMNVNNLNKGVYMVKVNSGNATEVKKVVIK